MRAIIIAAGQATRWNNHLGVPKHFAPVDGEPILHRTVRLLTERQVLDINIIAKPGDDRYLIDNAETHTPKTRLDFGDADKFLSSRDLWHPQDRTVIFYGDVYFTDSAMDTIVDHAGRDWCLFARPTESVLTGTPYGECFAYSIYPDHHQRFLDTLWHLVNERNAGRIHRCGGWETYRHLLGRWDVTRHVIGPNLVAIDDWTDDFDFPHDYDQFTTRRRAYTPIDPFDE